MATKKKTKTPATFVPSSPLGEAIMAGDDVAVDAALDAAGPAGWSALRAEARAALAHVSQGEWGQLPDSPNSYGFITPFTPAQKRAANRAIVVVGSASDAADALHHEDVGEALALLMRFKPAHLPELATVLVEHRWPNSDLAQRLITAGLSTRPTSDAYILALIRWSGTIWQRQRRGEAVTFASLVRSDPGLFTEGVLLRLFDVEGTREVSLGIHDKYGKDDSWASVLIGLVDDNLLARDVVIDKTLQALERDWPQFRTSWYLGFLAALSLTPDERRTHADRFVGLLNSRIPPTVTVALDVVKQLVAEGALAGEALLSGLAPVMAARGKGQVKLALKLAAQALNDETRTSVQRLATAALVNDDAELQGLALDLLAAPRDASIEDELQAMASLIVPRHRARFEALIGAPIAAVASSSSPLPSATIGADDPLAADRRLTTVTADDLVDVVARAVEDDSDPAVVEQALAALIENASTIAANPKPWAALKKRATKIHRALSAATVDLLVAILDDAAHEPVDHRTVTDASALFVARTRELRARASNLVPLALPTHRDGLIAVDELVKRVTAHAAAGVDVGMLILEGQLALLRLGPVVVDDPLRAAIAALPAGNFVSALRVAVGIDDVDDAFAATSAFAFSAYRRRYGPWSLSAPPTLTFTVHERKEHPDYTELLVERAPLRLKPPLRALLPIDAPSERFRPGFLGGGDLAGVRQALTIWPAAVDGLFVEAIAAVASNLDWWEAAWYQRAYFEALQQPLVRCTSATAMTTTMLVLGLAGKEPGQTAVAVDALVKGLADGRVVAAAVGTATSRLLDEGLVKGKRLAGALKAASDVDPARVRLLVEHALAGDPTRAPKDIAALLSLLLHLRVDVVEALPAATRAYVQGLSGGGQVAKDRKLLLA